MRRWMLGGLVLLGLLVGRPAWAVITDFTLRWAFDDGTGSVANDSAAGNNDGTISPATPVWKVPCDNARAGNCFTCNGATAVENGTVNIDTLTTPSAATFAVWVRPTGSAVSNAVVYELPTIFGDYAGFRSIARGTLTTQGSVDRIWFYNYVTAEIVIGVPYTAGTWIHVAWVLRGGQLLAFANGSLVTQIASGATNDGSSVGAGFRLCLDFSANDFLAGDLDDFRIYNRGLADAEVLELYNFGATAAPATRQRLMLVE